MFGTIALHAFLAALVGGGGFLLASIGASVVGDEARHRGADPELRSQLVAAVESGSRLAAVLAALAVLGVPMAPVVALLVLAAAIGAYAARDVLRDVMAGAWLFQTRPFRAGDRVKIGDVVGVVTSQTWLAVTLTPDAGGTVTLPAHVVASGPVHLLPTP